VEESGGYHINISLERFVYNNCYLKEGNKEMRYINARQLSKLIEISEHRENLEAIIQ
jgi:hypothetical protein